MLNQRQQRFVSAYLENGGNVYQACIAAGYSTNYAKARGHELLENVGIKQAIDQFNQQLMERTKVTIERVVAEIARLAFTDITQVVSWGNEGLKLKPSSEIPADHRAAITEITETPGKYGTRLTVKLYNKQTSLDQLMKHWKRLRDAGRCN